MQLHPTLPPTPKSPAPRGTTQIFAGKLYDPYTLRLVPRQLVVVSRETGLVVEVRAYDARDEARAEFGESAVDLRACTVLPGFVDAHVHLFLHPYSEVSWEDQLTRESLVERTVRATLHARRTLMAGYTSVRDLGTEGAGDADVFLRKCMSGPDALIPGPRYFVASRAIVATGSYGPRSAVHPSREGVEGITGAEVVDGEVECVKAVRRQVGAGADWIKVYADYRVRARMADVAPPTASASVRTFNDKELQAVIETAHGLGVKVAAHSSRWALASVNGHSADTVEHAYVSAVNQDNTIEEDMISRMMASSLIWVPTLSVFWTSGQGPGGPWERAARVFRRAVERGMKNIACGGDTGVFAHGDNALEMKLMVRLGADWRQVLRWATLGGWECIRSMAWEGSAGAERLAKVEELRDDARSVGDNDVAFGAIRKGFAADIVATKGDLEADFERAVDRDSIVFVMKNGDVYKENGKEVV